MTVCVKISLFTKKNGCFPQQVQASGVCPPLPREGSAFDHVEGRHQEATLVASAPPCLTGKNVLFEIVLASNGVDNSNTDHTRGAWYCGQAAKQEGVCVPSVS